MSGQRPSLLRSSRMLDVRAVSPELHLGPYCPSRCVAPCDVFPDYDRVMARLKDQHGGLDNLDAFSVEVTCYSREEPQTDGAFEDVPQSFDNSGSDGEGDISEDADGCDNEEYHAESQTRHAAADISNTYSSRATTLERRVARRSKPYSGRRAQLADPPVDAGSHERCAYISPHDGKRCKKLNRSPQEAGRHWKSCHLYKEAKAMLTGLLAVGKGAAITSEAQLVEVTPLIKCPFCNALITRSDAMRRHVRTNCKSEDAEGPAETEGGAEVWGTEDLVPV